MTMAPVLERLELERPETVTTAGLAAILDDAGVATSARVVASRLRENGWLLATGQRGVWEFVPAEAAGAYSRHDPVMPLKSYLAAHPADLVALTFQAGAWAHGLADRVPSRPEVAVHDGNMSRRVPDTLAATVFRPVLPLLEARGVPVLGAESILAHMAARPRDVRSWTSAAEWFPDLAARSAWDRLSAELAARPKSVSARAGYLLQGLRPDLSLDIAKAAPATSRVWFGPRGKMLRYDAGWQVADTLLPSHPRLWETVV
jgi:predicted transcriptional regulator of viral defense system